MTSKYQVLVTCLQMQEALEVVKDELKLENCNFICPELGGQQFNSKEMKALLRDVDFAIVGDDDVPASTVEESKLLGLIKWGIGFDSIDVDALESKQIRFSNTPGQFGTDVSEQVIAMLFALERGINHVDRSVRKGQWLKYRGRRVEGRSALILGFGNLGKRLAEKLAALGVGCDAFDPYAQTQAQGAVAKVFDTLPHSGAYDYMISCLPLTEETSGFVNSETLNLLADDGMFINVSRGKVVNQRDLISAIVSGSIGGAALDVYEAEPLSTTSDLVRMHNVVLGAHNSSNTIEGVFEASLVAGQILEKWIQELT